MCNNILYFDDFNPWQNTGGATEMLMEKLLGNICRQLCSQTELNVKPYIPQYPLKQNSNHKTQPFPHNSLTPKLGNEKTGLLVYYFQSVYTAMSSQGITRHWIHWCGGDPFTQTQYISSRLPHLKYSLTIILLWTNLCHSHNLSRKISTKQNSWIHSLFSPANIVNIKYIPILFQIDIHVRQSYQS